MYMGNVVGFRNFTMQSKNGSTYSGIEFCVLRHESYRSKPEFSGGEIDRFRAFANAVGDYQPVIGDGVRYHLFWANGRQQCGFVLPEPQYDLSPDDLSLIAG